MNAERRSPRVGYLVFAVFALLVAGVVAATGWRVLDDRQGAGSASAWLWGCGASLAASLVSGLLVSASGRLSLPGVTVALGSMLLRLTVLVLLASGLAVGLEIEPTPFLLALALSYLALLLVDTLYALDVLA